MDKAPLLSIIVPAYNVENYIKDCVESLLDQTFTDFELLLVDDGATDSTGAICDAYREKDSRVRVIHKENGGLVSTRKAGLQQARGEYAAYVDGDDRVSRDMFEKLCLTATEKNADIVIGDFMIEHEEDGRLEELTQAIDAGDYDRQALETRIIPCMLCGEEYFSFGLQPSLCGKVFRRSVLLPNQMAVNDRVRLGEDASCFYPTLLDASRMVYLKGEYLYFYRMRATSISHSINRAFYTEEIMLLIERLYAKFETCPELLDLLKPQLWKYGCYMIDNMITPHLHFGELFLSGKLREEVKLIAGWQLGQTMIEYGSLIRTSSRMKRIIKVIRRDRFVNRAELWMFAVYERIKNETEKRGIIRWNGY